MVVVFKTPPVWGISAAHRIFTAWSGKDRVYPPDLRDSQRAIYWDFETFLSVVL